jgi:hypothetical protein
MVGFAMYNKMVSAYIEKLQNADTSSEEKYNAVVDECNQELLEFICRMREIDPLLVPLTFVNENYPSNLQIEKFIQSISDRANNRRKLDYVFAGCCVTREIQKRIWRFPTFINFKETPNIGIYPKENNCHPRIISETLNQVLLSCLVSLPVGLVKVHLIDPQCSNMASYLTQIVPSDLWKIYHEDEEIYALWDCLTDYMKSDSSNRTSKGRYITHLIVILEYEHNSYERSTRLLRECGSQYGVHFIYASTKNLLMERNDVIIDEHYFFKNDKDEANLLFKPYKLINSPELVLACSNYLNSIPTEALNLLHQFENSYEELHKCHKEKTIIRKAEETARRKAEEEARRKADEETRKVTISQNDNVSSSSDSKKETNDNSSRTVWFPKKCEDLGELKKRMKEEGYDYLCPVSVYYDNRDKLFPNQWYVTTQNLFGKLFGNIMLFKLACDLWYTDVERIGEQSLYMEKSFEDEGFFVKINARFKIGEDSRYTYAYIPY